MNVLAPFHTALVAAIEAAWPDVTTIERVTSADRVNWNNAIDAGDYVPPFAIIEKPVVTRSNYGPLNGLGYQATPTIFYVSDMQTGANPDTAAAIEQKLSDLQDYLISNAFPFNVIPSDDDLDLDTSESNPVNAALLQSDAPFLAGSFKIVFLLGFIPDSSA